ncbi:MAG TPA: DNRLRE domain-containing protein [Bacteroidia bacterium]|nr:DNRLRE domain-containing protein [Bacteroidia bacterium]HNU32770.1 DNRLRE domain-containing protein [Bacteroidia bacterium]
MYKKLLSLSAAFMLMNVANAQTTLTLQPDATAGKDAEVFSCVPCGYQNSNYGGKQDFDAIGWTNGGSSSNVRSLIQFDLGSIPTNAVITDARLSLYHNTSSLEGRHFNTFFTPNTSYLRRVTSAWSEYGVTWNNQPTVTTSGQISLGATTSSTQNFTNINVKTFVQYWVSNPSQNFGMQFRVQTEAKFRKVIFASSDHPTASLRPKLVVTYTVPPAIQSNDEDNLQRPLTSAQNYSFTLANRFSINEVYVEVNAFKNANALLAIYDMSGKEIKQQKLRLTEGKNIAIVQTNDWNKGLYVAILKTDEAFFTEKFFIE